MSRKRFISRFTKFMVQLSMINIKQMTYIKYELGIMDERDRF